MNIYRVLFSVVMAFSVSSAHSLAAGFLGNGQADLFWEDAITGERGIWVMQSGVHSATIDLPTIPIEWHIAAAADFLGSGQADLVWENTITGERGIWVMQSGVHSATIDLPTIPIEWHIAAAADFLGTGQADLVWENTITGARGIWVMHNGVHSANIDLPTIPIEWHIAAAADFLGSGQADLVWENTITGARGIWVMHNGVHSANIDLPTIPIEWHIAAAADFLGSGQADLVWENTVTGERGIWVMHNGVHSANINLPTIATKWQISGASSPAGPTATSTPLPTPTPTPTPSPTPGAPALVQHVATGMENNGVLNFQITPPNPSLNGNCLILGIQYNSSGTVSSVSDNQGDAWLAGPSITSNGQTMALFYSLGVRPNTTLVTVAFNGIGGLAVCGSTQAVFSEFYNVASVSALDGMASSPTSKTAGTIVTTVSGDLIYEWGASLSTNTCDGGSFNGSNISAGQGFTLLSADLQVGSCDQYEVQPDSGPVTPSFSTSGSSIWSSVAIALKSASSGTQPGPGIRIVHVQHTLVGSLTTGSQSAPIPLQFPSTGNLLVGLFNYVPVTGVSDNAGNTWSLPNTLISQNPSLYAQIFYCANAQTSPNLGGITLSISGGQTSQSFLVLYDITGASSSPFDIGVGSYGFNTVNGNLTTVTITPSAPGEIVFAEVPISFNTINGALNGITLDSVVNTQDDDIPGGQGTPNSSLDEDNAAAHILSVNTNPITFTFTLNETYSDGNYQGAGYWSAVAASFK